MIATTTMILSYWSRIQALMIRKSISSVRNKGDAVSNCLIMYNDI